MRRTELDLLLQVAGGRMPAMTEEQRCNVESMDEQANETPIVLLAPSLFFRDAEAEDVTAFIVVPPYY